MATREKRLAQFDGSGEPPPDLPVEVLCEDHSGTYQLPFACRWSRADGTTTNPAAPVEATVIGWRMPRVKQIGHLAMQPELTRGACVQNATRRAASHR